MCATAAGIILVIMGIAATSERNIRSQRKWVSLSQAVIAMVALVLAPFSPQIIAAALLLLLYLCFIAQIAVLALKRRP